MLYLIAHNSFDVQHVQRVNSLDHAENVIAMFEAFGGPNNQFKHAAVWELDTGIRAAVIRGQSTPVSLQSGVNLKSV